MTATANRMVPIGLISIAAFLEQQGHEVAVLDFLGPGAPRALLDQVRAILDTRPELVGFSTTTSGFLNAYELAERVKQSSLEIATVFGGVHVSGAGETLLARFPAIDYLVLGEGEETISDLAAGMDPADIPGLAWRTGARIGGARIGGARIGGASAGGERIVRNGERLKITSLDSLPFPAYEKLRGFPKGYRLPPFSYIKTPGTAMSTSRGCVYQCSYCDRSVFKKGFRSNSAEYTYAHMKYLRERFGIRHINIYDDLFTTNRKRILTLCQALARKPLGVQFNCAVRVGHTDDELLGALKDAGCLMVSVGVESGDPALLKELKAGVSLDQVRETVAQIQSHGLRAKGLFMMGVVGETEESIRRTSDFVMELGLDDMNMSKFTPFPGAPCWQTIREHGSLHDDWRLMNALNFVFVPNGMASKEQLDQLYNEHVKRFYTNAEWRSRFKKRLWEHRHTLLYMFAHLPEFLAAKRQFEPEQS